MHKDYNLEHWQSGEKYKKPWKWVDFATFILKQEMTNDQKFATIETLKQTST
jgi:hypothetical protein